MARLDVVGLGSLNIDYIVAAADMPKTGRQELLSRFERGRERGIDDHEQFLSTLVRAQLGSHDKVSEAYGGSAFNFVRALRKLDPSLKIGFAGTLGRVESDKLPPYSDCFQAFDIDAGGVVEYTDGPAGKCLSIIDEDTRSLMTYYDDGFLAALESKRDRLVKFLCQARIIHVASFLGPAGPSRVLELIRAVQEKSRSVRLSVDPGMVWAASAANDPAVGEIVQRAQYVFANLPELCELGQAHDADAAASRILASSPSASMVVLKEWKRAVRFQWNSHSGRAVGETVEQAVLPIPQIVDSTGAGDFFAAGVIAGELSNSVQRSLALRLGLAAGRHRLQHLGDAAYDRLHEVVSGQWIEDSGTDLFISHAAADNELAGAFVELLEHGAGVPTKRLFYTSLDDTGVAAGKSVADEIRQHLIDARAVLVLITPAYLESPFCRYEYGGTWALGKLVYPLRVPAVRSAALSELQRATNVPQLSSRAALIGLYDFLVAHGIAQTTPATWQRHSDAFLRSTADAQARYRRARSSSAFR